MVLLFTIYIFSIRTFVDTSKVKHLCDNQSGRTITTTDRHVSTSYSNPQTTMFEPSLSPILVGDKIGMNIKTISRNPIKMFSMADNDGSEREEKREREEGNSDLIRIIPFPQFYPLFYHADFVCLNCLLCLIPRFDHSLFSLSDSDGEGSTADEGGTRKRRNTETMEIDEDDEE